MTSRARWRIPHGTTVGVGLVLAAAASLGWFSLMQPSTGTAQPAEQKDTKPEEGFAADRDNGFDAARAMRYLNEICKIGPRISGTDGMAKQQALLEKHFKSLGGSIEFQRFTAKQKSQKQPVALANLIVSWHPERTRRVILCSHYDTRQLQTKNPTGRSGMRRSSAPTTAVPELLSSWNLATAPKQSRPRWGSISCCLTARNTFSTPKPTSIFSAPSTSVKTMLGSDPQRYEAAILLDMVGGQNAHFPVEPNSWFKAGALVQQFWQVAFQKNAPRSRTRSDGKCLTITSP